jgi:hypothetical protein
MFGTYNRLCVNVHASNIDVIRAAKRKLKPKFWYDRATRKARHDFFRQMLAYHANAREIVKTFRL